MKLEDVLPEARKGKLIGRSNGMLRSLGDWAGSLYNEDLNANDWRVEEEVITISKTQFFTAISDTLKEFEIKRRGYYVRHSINPDDLEGFKGWAELATKLGFK